MVAFANFLSRPRLQQREQRLRRYRLLPYAHNMLQRRLGQGCGGWEELIKGKIGDWKQLKKMDIEGEKRMKPWLLGLKQRRREWLVQEVMLAAVPVLRQQHRKRRPALLRFLLHSENSLTKPKAALLVPDSQKSSEIIEGSNYESTPSCPSFGAAGAQDGN